MTVKEFEDTKRRYLEIGRNQARRDILHDVANALGLFELFESYKDYED